MKKVYHYILDYQKKHYHGYLYLSIGLLLTLGIFLNYYYNFENGYLDKFYGKPIHLFLMGSLQMLPILFVSILLYVFNINRHWVNSMDYWKAFVIGFLIIGFDRSMFIPKEWMDQIDPKSYYFLRRVFYWGGSLIYTVVPILIVSILLKDNKYWNFYGLKWNQFDAKPYLFMLSIAIVIIGLGSFWSDIQKAYPRYPVTWGTHFADSHSLPRWIPVIIAEAAYGINFVSVELFFRGFLVMAFARTLGSYAVLPMVVSYAFLHFGKPVGETISSIFGGYILGIIAYESKNVWGGIMIHVGVAWSMEVFGYLQK